MVLIGLKSVKWRLSPFPFDRSATGDSASDSKVPALANMLSTPPHIRIETPTSRTPKESRLSGTATHSHIPASLFGVSPIRNKLGNAHRGPFNTSSPRPDRDGRSAEDADPNSSIYSSRHEQSRRPRLQTGMFSAPNLHNVPGHSRGGEDLSTAGFTSFSTQSVYNNGADNSVAPSSAVDTEYILNDLNTTQHDFEDSDDGEINKTFRPRNKHNGISSETDSFGNPLKRMPSTQRERRSRDHTSNHEEALLQYLCDIDGGFELLVNRTKQNMNACKEAVTFLKKRAQLEEEYGRNMTKLVQGSMESGARADTKKGIYGERWTTFLRLHETMGENRVKFAGQIAEVANDLVTAYKDSSRSRKQLKEAGSKHERYNQDADNALEKAKVKYEASSEDWERSILQKNGDVIGSGKKTLTRSMSNPINLFKHSKVPAKLNKQEEDARYKAALANEGYKQQLSITNAARVDYYQVHLPQILKSIKETVDESDVALQYQLGKYAFCFETIMMADATTLSPLDDAQPGLRNIVEQIDNVKDLESYIAEHSSQIDKIEKAEIPYVEYGLSATAHSLAHPRNIFGVDLSKQLVRDGHEVPPILIKCTDAIEKFGLSSQGVYRISGSSADVQKLRTMLDRNYEMVNFDKDDRIRKDINTVTGILKLFFRELPDPLLTSAAYGDFIEASKIEDDRLRVITMHDHVNNLPDANYATLRHLMRHLDQVQAHQRTNKMGISNLGIVFGPTLMGSPPVADPLNDMSHQCKVVETILENYKVIFEPDE